MSGSNLIRKTERTHENCQIHHRPEGQPPHTRFSSPKAAFCRGICNLGVPNGFELFEGGTTGFHHDAARNFAGRDLHTSARTSERLGRFEPGNYEPDYQSTQSAPVPTQRRRRANFRAIPEVHASNHYHKACEIGRRRRRLLKARSMPEDRGELEGFARCIGVPNHRAT